VGPYRIVPFLVSELRLPPGEHEELGVEWWPSYAHAVEHPGGIFLFDNGAGTGNAEIEATFTPRVRPVEDALAAVGVSLADVTAAANCHLHFDHSGQNAKLTGMPIFVQRTEWGLVHTPDYTVPEWIDVPGLAYELLDGETEVATGLRLIPTPGHTPGHQSLVIDAPEGRVVLAGQAVQSRAEWGGS
jgi:N-acyl homoserine lactone hydrolase